MTLGNKAVEVALKRVGTKEIGENWGRPVQIYLAFVHVFRPAAWCAAFLALMVHNAAKELGVKAAWPKSGYVQSVVNWAKKSTYLRDTPENGYAFVVWHPELKRYAHIGLIADTRKVHDHWEFLTVEGNSSTTGGREGKEVVSMWRAWNPARHRCFPVR